MTIYRLGRKTVLSMASTVPPLRTHVPLHPILYFFNIVLNFLVSFVYFLILWFYCHFNIEKRAILWIFVILVMSAVHPRFR